MSTNDITGARLVTKPNTKEYEEGYDRIFSKKGYTKEESDSKGTGSIQLQNRNLIKDNEKDIIND